MTHFKARLRLTFHFTKPGEWKHILISFVGKPDAPLDITVVGAFDITKIPGLNGVIQGAILGALDAYVEPNQYKFIWTPDPEEDVLVVPKGNLSLELVEAKNLKTRGSSNKCDPYCVFTVPNSEGVSSATVNSCNPVWKEALCFRIEDPKEDILVQIRDSDNSLVFADGCLGDLKFNVYDIFGDETDAIHDKWFEFKSHDQMAKLRLILKYEADVAPDHTDIPPESPMDAGVEVDPRYALVLQGHCRKLPKKGKDMVGEEHKRFLKLNASCLESYKRSGDTVPTRIIPVYDITSVACDKFNVHTSTGMSEVFGFVILYGSSQKGSNNSLKLVADTESARNRWVSNIQETMELDHQKTVELLRVTGHLPTPAPKRADFDKGFILCVDVLKARNLVAADPDTVGSGYGTSDPFVTLRFGNQEFRTRVISTTLNPLWNESFEFTVDRNSFGSHDCLQVEVWDYDMISDNDPIGECEIEVLGGGPRLPSLDSWLPLRKTKRGEVCMSWSYRNLGSKANSPKKSNEREIQVKICHLNGWDSEEPQRFLCRIKLNGVKFETRVSEKSDRPEWNERFTFPADLLTSSMNNLEIKIYTYHQSSFLNPSHKVGFILLQVPTSENPDDRAPVLRPITPIEPGPSKHQLVAAIWRGS